jgi:transposase InsO family protein
VTITPPRNATCSTASSAACTTVWPPASPTRRPSPSHTRRPNRTPQLGTFTAWDVYLPIADGSNLYLATVIDCCSRRLAGWAIADHMRTELIADALTAAGATRWSLAGAIFHSDYADLRIMPTLVRSGWWGRCSSRQGRHNPRHRSHGRGCREGDISEARQA